MLHVRDGGSTPSGLPEKTSLTTMEISPHDFEVCLRVLQQIADDPSIINDEERMKGLIAKIHKTGKKGQAVTARRERVRRDRQKQAATGRVQLEAEPVPLALNEAGEACSQPNEPLENSTNCYICKQPYRELHFFYHKLCPQCAAFNYAKRTQRCDLTGRIALVTGGRIKIGHEVALRLLRDGARVLVTTRFPRDAARQFAAHEDYHEWENRLQIYGLDLRNIPAVEEFCEELLQTESSLDIIINNACQTVKRPRAYYAQLIEAEGETPALPQPVLLETLPAYPLVSEGDALHFPVGKTDSEQQPLDLRPTNSWRLLLDEVSTLEMLEVQLVNAVAPFILNGRLKPLMLRSAHERRFIVNVSAMEGQFNRESKTAFHPHTNMAKAALNMMTRTSAQDYARNGIYMNSVDTGWITDENPHPIKTALRDKNGFYAPLDAVDGMARIYDPIVQGIVNEDEPLWGHFLKDYGVHPW